MSRIQWGENTQECVRPRLGVLRSAKVPTRHPIRSGFEGFEGHAQRGATLDSSGATTPGPLGETFSSRTRPRASDTHRQKSPGTRVPMKTLEAYTALIELP